MKRNGEFEAQYEGPYRDLTYIRRRRRGRRLVKNVFLFYFEISHLLRFIQCVCWH